MHRQLDGKLVEPVRQAQEYKTLTIAVLPGDGIGIEVTDQAMRVLQMVAGITPGVRFEFVRHSVGAQEYLRSGNPLPESAFNACQNADAVLLGAMGLPSVRCSDGRELTPQIDLRERLDLYCGLRPVRLFHKNDSPLKKLDRGDVNLLLVRENTEGLFSSRLSSHPEHASEVTDIMRITRPGSERIIRAAFKQAQKRRQKVTLVDKANVLPSMVFFRRIFDSVAETFPDVQSERIYVDAAALYLLQRPHTFDVIVTENMFGDILSDLTAGLVGGMGMAPSADLGENCGVFQPSHGTAPDIAGKGIANPVAAILSAAMMLDWLGLPETRKGSQLIELAVENVLADPTNRTPDLGGKFSTAELTNLIISEIQKLGGSHE